AVEIDTEALEEGGQGRLGGAVGGARGEAADAGERRDTDQVPAASRDHLRQGGGERRDRTEGVDLQDRRDVAPGELRRVAGFSAARVRDDEVEGPKLLPRRLDGRDGRVRIGDVDLDDERAAALGLDAPGDFVEQLAAAGGEGDGVTSGGEALGERAADA